MKHLLPLISLRIPVTLAALSYNVNVMMVSPNYICDQTKHKKPCRQYSKDNKTVFSVIFSKAASSLVSIVHVFSYISHLCTNSAFASL